MFSAQVTSSTATLIVVSIILLTLNIPRGIYFILSNIDGLRHKTAEDIATLVLLDSCNNFIYFVNCSTNFLMYSISGRKFRQAAKDTIICQWCTGGSQLAEKSTTAGRSAGGVTGVITTNFIKMEDISITTVSGAL